VEQVPLGIRKPRSPKFDAGEFVERQRMEDEEREALLERLATESELEAPELHRDYEIRDDEDLDRHLEGITRINALKELIANAKEEVENELEITVKPFSVERVDELMVFTEEAVKGHGEEKGYYELKRRIHALILEDIRFAQEELDRKKDAYLRSSGK